MKVYALNVRNVELDKRFYKTLIDMGFNFNSQLRHMDLLQMVVSPEVYWLFFDNYKRYLSSLHESDVTDEGYSADLEGASKYIQHCLEDEEVLVEEFNWRKADVPCIDLGQLM